MRTEEQQRGKREEALLRAWERHLVRVRVRIRVRVRSMTSTWLG